MWIHDNNYTSNKNKVSLTITLNLMKIFQDMAEEWWFELNMTWHVTFTGSQTEGLTLPVLTRTSRWSKLCWRYQISHMKGLLQKRIHANHQIFYIIYWKHTLLAESFSFATSFSTLFFQGDGPNFLIVVIIIVELCFNLNFT